MKKLFPILMFLLLTLAGSAQPQFPDNGPLYDDNTVPRIDITINPDTLNWIYENPDSDIEFHARFVFHNGSVLDTIDPVGFRLRGNTSRYSAKKSFKVSFNTFTSGGKYYGVEKLNLNGEHNDPTIMRSKVMWDILRKMDVPAPRANHVELYINGNYHGLYLNVEHIDEEFVLNRFGNNDGNLYKCLWPADLDYLGSDPDLYKFMSGDHRTYELKTNEELDDYSDLAAFIDVINNTDNAQLVCSLDGLFNTYDYLKVAAADVYCGNWDGYIYNKNNFYLYHNTATDKMEYIAYDVDNTFGIDWFNIDWATRNIYHWEQDGQPRPLYTRLMNLDELRNQYSHASSAMLNTTLDTDSLKAVVLQRRDMIAPFVEDDPYYPLDYGFSYNDFLNSYNQALGMHVKAGLLPFLDNRKAATLAQVETNPIKPEINYISHFRQAAQKVQIQATVLVGTAPANVVVSYQVNGGNSQQLSMTELYAGRYTALITNVEDADYIDYQIMVTDGSGLDQTLPCIPKHIAPLTGDTPLLFVNELMADNETTIADEYGNYSDWVEIFNGDDMVVNLGDFFLTDNLSEPMKWPMPDMELEPGGFVLFWADGDPTLGSHHAAFKLSKDGEECGIFNAESIQVDAITFGPQEADISYGRFPDGTATLEFFHTPTPGAPNQPDGLAELTGKTLLLYPNPVHNAMVHLNFHRPWKLYHTTGQLIMSGTEGQSIDATGLAPGMYIVTTDQGLRNRLMVY